MIDDITHWLASIPDNVLMGVLAILLLALVYGGMLWSARHS